MNMKLLAGVAGLFVSFGCMPVDALFAPEQLTLEDSFLIMKSVGATLDSQQEKSAVVDSDTLETLKVLASTKEGLVPALYRGKSIFGFTELYSMITNPITSTQQLEIRKKALREIYLAENFNDSLEKIADLQQHLLVLFNSEDTLLKEINRVTGFTEKEWFTELKRSFKVLAFTNPITSVGGVIQSALLTICLSFATAFVLARNNMLDTRRGKVTQLAVLVLANMVLGLLRSNKELRIYLRKFRNIVKLIGERMQAFLSLRQCAIELYEFVRTNKIPSSTIPYFKELQAFVLNPSEELEELFSEINQPRYDGTGRFLTYYGAMLKAYGSLHRLKHQFLPVLRAVGSIEAYWSMGRLLKEKADGPNPWCFTQFVQKERPELTIESYVHPLIPDDKAVPNSIAIGGDQTHQGLVVSGPNASGKSVNLDAITLSLLLSQSFGVAPARSAIITPMHKIICFANIVDDLTEDRSLFQAEEDRIEQIFAALEQAKKDEFVFIMADELMNSTAPQEGASIAYGVGYGMAQYPNCIPVLATHYRELVKLPDETNGFYKNYHVYVKYTPEHEIVHPYKLEPGKSHQVIAIDLAKKQGFETGLLEEADQILRDDGYERGRKL
jgi:DNA mismatch repair ATPase MutS